MKVTMIGVLPPEKSLCHYCDHLAKEISKIINLEFFSFKNLKSNSIGEIPEIERKKEMDELKQANVKYNITTYNPFSWFSAGLKARGDIVHVQHWAWYTGMAYCLILPIIKLRGKKIVISIHNITPHVKDKSIVYVDSLFNKIIYSYASALIVHNKRNERALNKLYNTRGKKISIITHGVLTLDNVKNISKKEARNYLGITENKKVILFFGYLWKYKGLDVMLKSLALIKEEVKDVFLVIAGQPFRHWKDYERIINELHLGEYVKISLGYIPDSKFEYYFSATDICVFPYKEPFDTHGGAAALALFFKKPIVVTDIGGLPEYVKDKIAVSKPEDVDGLSDNIIKILKDEKLLNKLILDSEQLNKELTWDKIAIKTVDFYKELLK